jgi:hypothetical protein
MIKKVLLHLVFTSCFYSGFAQDIQSPEKFLGYKLGTQFTPHYKIVEYFNYIAKASKNVKITQYGATNEGRPLMTAFVASDENINRLEEIRKNNLKTAGLLPEGNNLTAINNTPVIVWLSFNVHGNEPASSETAMQVLFDLLDPTNSETKNWLKNTLVVIDPCLNPDGRDRYVNFYNSVKGLVPNADPSSREHAEPWPRGRVNHYYFDLNRDWAWQTQKETQARLAIYNKWLPQVHVDFHEQGYNAPYYFAPAAEPFHKVITKWQRDFQVIIGKNNAKYFDQHGWLYFTKQEFDLLYPSYGDTYPIYSGAIGMTFEQGGISAGLAVMNRSGDSVTLVSRIAHHRSTALSTIEMSSNYAQKLITEFKTFYDNCRNVPTGEYKTYIVKNDNADKIKELTTLLDRNGISYGYGLKASTTGYNYFTQKTEAVSATNSDLVINAYQSKSVLLNVLFEPKTFMTDSNTYDITAWSLPYAFGLNAYGIKESLKPISNTLDTPSPALASSLKSYAYLSTWQSVSDVKFLAALLNKGIKVRYAEKPFEAAGKKFNAGSLLITRAGNDFDGFDKEVTQIATEQGHEITPVSTGFVESGADFGSSDIRYIHKPRVLLIAGTATSSEAMGEIWHYFEQQINYPVTLIRYEDLKRARLTDYDVMIFPDGDYDDFPADRIQSWVNEGGKLITIENAILALADKKGFNIRKKEDKKEDKADDKLKNKPLVAYADRDRDALTSSIPGAIYKLNLDNTHPLGYGFPSYYYSLKQNDNIFEFLKDDGWNVGTVKKDGYVAGFVGQKTKVKIQDGVLLGVQNMGRGTIVFFADDPIFRRFWKNGDLLLGNAIFMVGQ